MPMTYVKRRANPSRLCLFCGKNHAVWEYAARIKERTEWPWVLCEDCSYFLDRRYDNLLIHNFMRSRGAGFTPSMLERTAMLILNDFTQLSISTQGVQ